jgi:hypothetical protein
MAYHQVTCRQSPSFREQTGGSMIKRVSLVKLRPGLDREEALEMWLGPHADVVRAMPTVREYVIALADEPSASGWDGIATLRFDSVDDLSDALEDPVTARALVTTREPFLAHAEAFLVNEHQVVAR